MVSWLNQLNADLEIWLVYVSLLNNWHALLDKNYFNGIILFNYNHHYYTSTLNKHISLVHESRTAESLKVQNSMAGLLTAVGITQSPHPYCPQLSPRQQMSAI